MSPCLSKGLGKILAVLQLSRSYSQSSTSQSYFISRNSRGSLPVYSDIRNGGTRYLITVKNIRGDIHALRNDVASSLFPAGSDHTVRLKAEIARPDTLVVSGGRWKRDIMGWLQRKGF